MGEAEVKNYYQLLGVEKTATKEQIRDAYKELARIYHPDSHFYDEVLESAGVAPNESQVFKLITDAYNTLSNEKQRAEYDKSMLGDLPGWDDEKTDEWHESHHQGGAESERGQDRHRHASNAFGNFGVVRNGQQPVSAMDDKELNSVRAVSEMLKVKRGLWWKIRWLLFLDK